jgi:hypothetical protein
MAKPMHQRRLDREQFWRKLIRRQQRSGQSIRAFCAEQGVSEPSFFAWRKKLAGPDNERQPDFVPVHVVDGSLQSAGHIEILLPGSRRVRVETGFDRQTLRDVLTVLEEATC